MKDLSKLLILFIAALKILSCSQQENNEKEMPVLYNQVGYITNAPKLLLVAEDVNNVIIIDAQGNEVFSAIPEEPLFWEQSGDAVRKVDFSQLNVPGTYLVVLPETDENFEIQVKDQPFREITKAALEAFYYNRSGMAIEAQYGGRWARPAGHPDTVIYVHSSAADENRPEGTIISSPLGWYDAGDYNKYIVNSGITTYTLLSALTHFTDYYKKLDVNIPESGSGVPDLLSETLYNLKWMLTMQDPHDGGVYHKLTTKNFEGMVMPHEATNDRFVVSKGTAATLNYAAVAAKAYRVLKDYESHFPGLAEKCLQKAEKAWGWAMSNPNLPYVQPEDIFTGGYGDRNFSDEFFWTASELFLSTGKDEYLDVIIEKYSKPVVPSWSQVYALGFISLLNNYDELPEIVRNLGLRNDFIALIDELVEASKTAPYGVSIQNFVWGSNSQVANEGMLKIKGYQLTGNRDYLYSALSDLDYILGRNATGYCFVTGFGYKKVMNIHHRPSEADDNEAPVPGFLAGGPNVSVLTDCGPEVERSPYPAKSYVDLECSYSTNEVAINWNAPLVYLSGAIDALLTQK
ncbi:glycoside hydrolase family 9 protein [Natronoflexus pectinivorans]|uniref:Endoglucanase n=1 Tax=Natronoflexus pectinivorans TaxID=682526 RepID=A0A4R2GMM4_9BACT|nr:glycoside hydrolase family 9 protein [Natronoflexus pectinivorans]TCO08853.1 endoglucanase [Natronoflexus pectinivorans]